MRHQRYCIPPQIYVIPRKKRINRLQLYLLRYQVNDQMPGLEFKIQYTTRSPQNVIQAVCMNL